MRVQAGLSEHSDKSVYAQRNIVYLSLILLLGIFLRLYDLGTESFWFDEIITVQRISQDLPTLLHQLATQGNVTRNAVYYLLAHFWVLPMGVTEVTIRSLSALFGVLSIGLMYLVGRKLFGEKVGLVSSFFMAVSEFQIQHAQEARFYSLFVLMTLVSIYCYIHALQAKRMRWWVLSGLVNIILFYTHTYAIFIFVVEGIHYLVDWKNNKAVMVQWGVSQALLVAAIVIGFIPMLRSGSVGGLGGGLAWITVPSLKDLMLTIYEYLFPQNYQHSWFFIGASFGAGAVFFIAGVFFYNFRKTGERWFTGLSDRLQDLRMSNELVLVVVWFVFPLLVPFLYSNFFPPIFVDRYTICVAPAFYLMVALGVTRIERVAPIYISLCAMMIVILPGLQDYYVADINEQWQEVAGYVEKNSNSNDVIVFAPDDNGYQTRSFDWYYQGSLPSCGIGSNTEDEQAVAEIVSGCVSGHGRLWVIMRGPSEVINRFTSFFLAPGRTDMLLIQQQHFVKISVYLFELAK